MARSFQLLGNGGFTLPTAAVDDEAVAVNANVAVTKLRHLHLKGTPFGLAPTGTPVTTVLQIHRATAAGIVRNFRAILNVCGSASSMTFVLKKNGAQIGTTLTLTNATGNGVAVVSGSMPVTYAANDIFTLELTVTTSTGAQGPWAEVEFDEIAA